MTEGRPGAPSLTPHAALALVALVSIILGSWVFADHLVDLGGPRWDAWYYTGVARAFPHLPAGFRNPYQMQRVIPSLLVNFGLRLTGQPRSVESVTFGFLVLDLLILVAAGLLWLRIARRERFGVAGFWLGFTGLFFTFASLRFVAWNPAMTDTAALLLGLMLIVAYLERRPLLLTLVALVGGFTWPVVTITAVPLLLFPRSNAAPAVDPADDPPPRLPIVIGVLAALLYLGRFGQLYLGGVRRVHSSAFTPINEDLVWLSALIVAVYLYVVTRSLLANLTLRRSLSAVTSVRLRDGGLTAVTLAVPWMITRVLAAPGVPPPITGVGFLSFLTILPAVHPGRFLVAHALYFSPVLLLTIKFWPRIASAIRETGLGMVGAVLFSCYIALSTESRQSTLAWPMVVMFTVAVSVSMRVPSRIIAFFGIASVLSARPWSQLNDADAPHRVWSEPEMLRYLSAYFDHAGPWMSERGYLLRLLIVAVLSAGFWLLWRLPGWSRSEARRGNMPTTH
jgi:hypothetical protein